MAEEEGPIGPEAIAAGQQHIQQLLEIEKIQGNIKTQADAELFVKQQTLVAQREELKLIAEAQAKGDEIIAGLHQEIDLIKAKDGERTAADKAAIAALEAQIGAVHERQVLEKDVINELLAQADALEDNLTKTQNLTEATKTALEALTGIGDAWKGSATGAFLSTVKTQGFAAAIGAAGKGLKEVFTMENIAGSLMVGVVQQTMKAVMGLDNARASVSKSLGSGEQYDAMVTEVYQDTLELGVSSGEAAQALIGLSQNMAGFGMMTKDAQKDLVGFAATMAEIGVDAGTTGQLLTNTTKVMGMSKDESKAFGAELGGLANTLGVSIGQITGDFNSVMGDLAVYGKEAPQVFKKLAGASAALGISIDGLVGSMQELDTISGAAKRAGQLNAALGGQFLDTNELLNASLEERVVMIKEALDASGKDFESMSRAEKQMVANAAGMKDAGELAKFMNTNMGDLTGAMDEAGNATGSLDDMKDKAAAAQSAQERLTQAMESLAIAVGPITDIFAFFADIVAAIAMNPLGKWAMIIGASLYFIGGPLGSVVTGFSTFFATMKTGLLSVKTFVLAQYAKIKAMILGTSVQAASTTATAADTGVKATNAAATQGMAAANTQAAASGGGFIAYLKTLLSVIQPNITALLALGATFVMIGFGVFLAAYGVAELVRSFAGFSAGEILAIAVALAVFGLTMIGIVVALAALVMSGALPAAAGGLLAFGAAVALVGLGVLLMAVAFGLFVDAFIMLVPLIPFLAFLAMSLMFLAVAGMMMLPGGLLALIGLAFLSAGLVLLAIALWMVPSDDLRSLADMMMGLGMVAQFAGAGISDAVPAVEELFDMLSDMSLQLMMSMGLFQALGNAFYDMGWGAMMAALFLPALVVPLMLIGAGVVVWSDAMQSLNLSLQQFFTFIPQWYEIINVFIVLVPLMNMMALAVLMMAMFGFAAFFGLLMLSHGLNYVAESLSRIFEPTLSALVDFIDMVSQMTYSTIDMIYQLADAMWWLGFVTEYMPIWRFMSFSYSLERVGDAAEKLEVLTAQRVDHVVEVVEAAREYSRLDLDSRYSGLFGGYDNDFERLIEKIGSALGSSGGGRSGGGSSSGATTVVLVLDGKELGRTVEALLSKRNKLTSMT